MRPEEGRTVLTARRCCVAIGLALIVIGLTCASWARGPLKVRIGWVAAPARLLSAVLTRPACLTYAGETYRVQPVHFRGTTPPIMALAAGERDSVMPAYFSFALAVRNSRMDDLRPIADGHRDGVPDHRSGPFYVRAQGTIRNPGYEGSGPGDQRYRRRHLFRVAQDHARPNLDATKKNLGVMRELGLLTIYAT